jgi:hypothetical protein
MKGKLRKFEGNWVVDYFVDGENSNAIYTLKMISLHPNDVDRMIDEDSGREVDFNISVCVPPNLGSTNGDTVSFDAVKYARLTFTPGLSDKTLDELFSLHEPDDFINEKDEELLIELEEWCHTCGDGCCETYGTNIYINGEQLEDEDGTSQSQLLKAVLNKLGYTDVRVEYK